MTGTFAFLFLITAVLTAWGLAKPQHFAKYARSKRPTRKHLGVGFGTLALVFFVLVGVTAPPQSKTKTPTVQFNASSTSSQTKASAAKPKNTVTTKQVSETQPIPFTTTTQNDSSLTKGQTKIAQAGKDGVSTLLYKVTYTNGAETSRTLISQTTTTAMVPEIVGNGTYVAPAPPVEHPMPQTTTQTGCTNGTYVNSSGNTVCSPESAPSAPAGATAQCNDGTYSFSQHHSGTCSGHGGVAEWL